MWRKRWHRCHLYKPKFGKKFVHKRDVQSSHSVYLNSDTNVVSKKKVLIDSGCTDHVLTEGNIFHNFKLMSSKLKHLDGNFCQIEGIREVKVEFENGNGLWDRLILKGVLLLPNYETNLLSVPKMNEKGHSVDFSAISLQLKTKRGVNYNLFKQGNIYTVPMTFIEPPKFVPHAKKNSELEKKIRSLNERSTTVTVPSLEEVHFFLRNLCT